MIKRGEASRPWRANYFCRVFLKLMRGVITSFPSRPLHPLHDHPLRLRRVGPALDLHSLARLQILVVGKKVLDLLDRDLGQIRVVLDAVVALRDVARGHRDDLLVLAGIVLHHQHTDRAHAHDRAGNDRARVRDEHIARVAIAGKCVRDEPVVPRIAHRGASLAPPIDHLG
jgi:hypothetical protein